jgi:hypothetical protein
LDTLSGLIADTLLPGRGDPFVGDSAQRALDHRRNGLQIDDIDVEPLSPLGSDDLTLSGRYRIAL